MRFPEFTDEWEKQKLSDFVERVTRKNKNNESKLPLTISAQYGLVNQITFFNKVIASNDISGYYLLKKGEFAYNKSYSGDYTWGAVKRLDRYEQGVLSTLYICFSPLKCVISDYLVHYFETKKWHREVSEIAVEGARNHGLLNIRVADYFNTKHFLPTKKEQNKIAAFLNLIEKRIALQTKIIEDLKKLKSALYHLIFSTIDSRSLKISHMRAYECIICDNRPLSLCHEPPKDPFEKAQKEPHGSFEVICGSSEHDIYRVSEKTLVNVPSQTMVALASTTVFPLFLSSSSFFLSPMARLMRMLSLRVSSMPSSPIR